MVGWYLCEDNLRDVAGIPGRFQPGDDVFDPPLLVSRTSTGLEFWNSETRQAVMLL